MQLETERLILREFTADDFSAVHAYAIDTEVTRYVGWGPNSEEDTKAFLAKTQCDRQINPRTAFELAIVLKENGALIGGIGVRASRPEQKTGDIGYILNRASWGRGFATEAAAAIVRFAFCELKLHRVIATCDVVNTASAHVLEKLGMRREGHFRKDVFERDHWRDSLLYAILEDEYFSKK